MNVHHETVLDFATGRTGGYVHCIVAVKGGCFLLFWVGEIGYYAECLITSSKDSSMF